MDINVDTKLIPYLSLLEGAIGYITKPVESIQDNRVDSFKKTIILARKNGVTERSYSRLY